ncbi:hypothetical protein GCM10029964_029600 [Kibdelosporangium lantanae]
MVPRPAERVVAVIRMPWLVNHVLTAAFRAGAGPYRWSTCAAAVSSGPVGQVDPGGVYAPAAGEAALTTSATAATAHDRDPAQAEEPRMCCHATELSVPAGTVQRGGFSPRTKRFRATTVSVPPLV